MIALASLVWVGRSDAAGAWSFVTVPEEQSGDIRAAERRHLANIRVPARQRRLSLPVKAKPRRDAGIAAGDSVTVRLELIVG